MRKKLLSILALLCLMVSSAWATVYTSFSGGEVLKPGDSFEIAEGSWYINGMEFQSSRSPFTVLRAYVNYGQEVIEDEEFPYGMCYVIKDNDGDYYFADKDNDNILPVTSDLTDPPTTYDGIAVTKTDATHYTFAGHELSAATSGYCGDPSDNDGKNVTWEVTGTIITISGSGAMNDFDSPQGDGTPAPWLAAYADKITSIVIGGGVTTVGDYAFENCKIVESISIPASVTSIGHRAFYRCGYTDDYTTTDLAVTIASGSNLETIGNSAFEYCPMTSFSIPNGVKTIDDYAFSYCLRLTSIEIPASVTSIGEDAFSNCNNLATLTLNSNPYIHANAFALAGQSVGDFSVTMNLTATVVESGEYWMTFYNQNHNFQVPATGTQIFKAALSDDKLMLAELTTDKIVKANNAVILKSATASITLTRTTGGGSNDYTGNGLAGVSDVAGETSDGTFYALNDGTQDVGFYPVASGTKVDLGNAYVTSTSSSDFLPFVTVLASGNCGTTGHESEVTWSLTSDGTLTISGTGAMADYAAANKQPWYSSASSITTVVVEAGVTHIGNHAFRDFTNMTSVTLPDGLETIGSYAFYGCTNASFTSITIPASVTSTGTYIFTGCTYLATVEFSAGSNLTGIGNYAFRDCTALSSIEIPAGVTSIGMYAFQNCSSLGSIEIPAGVTSIGSRAFQNCTSLGSINIPASVTSIDSQAFDGCTSLATITLNSNPYLGGTSVYPSDATVTMNLTANGPVDEKYWMTFYNQRYNFVADENTQVFKAELSGTSITLHEVTDRIVTKKTAVILKSTGKPLMTKTADTSSNDDANSLRGVMSSSGMTVTDPSTTYVLNNGSQGVGFYKLAGGNTLEAYKAYLLYDGGGASVREFFGFEMDDADGIVSPLGETEEGAAIYNLSGQRVQKMQKGINIVNGKKIIK